MLGYHLASEKLLQGAHRCASYRIRTTEGIGQSFDLAKGFREGDPSSPASFNLYHAAALTHVRHKIKDAVPEPGVAITTIQESDRWMRKRMYRTTPRHAQQHGISGIEFADDTTLIARANNWKAMEDAATQGLAECGEKANRSKTPRIRLGRRHPSAAPRETDDDNYFDQNAKVVGCVIDENGKQAADTQHRIASARKVWNKLWQQIPRLHVEGPLLGRVIQSTVLTSLLYGMETRPVSKQCENKMQTLLNKMLLGCTSTRRSEMVDQQLTTTDLAKQFRIDPI